MQKFKMAEREIEMIRIEADSPFLDYFVKTLKPVNKSVVPYHFNSEELKSFVNMIPQSIYESVKPHSKLDELLYEIEEYLIDSHSVVAE